MPQSKALKFWLELAWLVLTLLVCIALIAPIYWKVKDFPFFTANVLFIAVFVTAARYIFLLEHTFLARRQVLKVAFFFLSIPLALFLVGELHRFQTFLDDEGVQALVAGLPYQEVGPLAGYIRAEMLLFGVGSIIAMVVFALRMIQSVWLTHNRGTV
jgi:hypothetical protein